MCFLSEVWQETRRGRFYCDTVAHLLMLWQEFEADPCNRAAQVILTMF